MGKRYYTYEARIEGIVSPRAAAECARSAECEQGERERRSSAVHEARASAQRRSEVRSSAERTARPHAHAASQPERSRAHAATRPAALGKLTHLYESRDRRLVVLEDARGHVAAVKAERLA